MYITKDFYLSKDYKIYLISFKNHQILLIKFLNRFIRIFKLPKFIFLNKQENKLSIYTKSQRFEKELISFCNVLFTTLKNAKKMYKKTLILKGLGFKTNFSENVLQFKLGFSHLVNLRISPNILICVKKNIITFESYNLALIGNLTNKIRSLKFPNTYKAKGFWYKNENRILKNIKKT
jgi:large subunit ribosomal protein L6